MSRMNATAGTHRNFALAACFLALPASAATLDEVIVTATRSPVALASYPGSATRIAADASELVGATHASELVNRAAGAMIQRGSGQESLTALRSPVLTGAGACGAVLVLEDGIPIRPVGTCNVNELFEVNLEQAAAIEVLRGPGSVLYGSSAVHGDHQRHPADAGRDPGFRRRARRRQRRLAQGCGSRRRGMARMAASASSCMRPTTAAGETHPASRSRS